MNIRRYNTWSLLDELNRAFQEAKNQEDSSDGSVVETSNWMPAVDIKETPDAFIAYADLPGVDAKDIDISMEGGVLTVKGERKFQTADHTESFTRTERVSGTFYRKFTLPETADSEKISAKSKNGVLELTIPKTEKALPKRIEITSEE